MTPHKILIVHNAYKLRGGEDSVVDAEFSLLKEHGHEVRLYKRHNEELSDASYSAAVVNTFWSRSAVASLQEIMEAYRPDVVHFHNTFPLISPSAYWAVRFSGVAVVQTLHNFRLHCPQAMYLRDGRICEECNGNIPWRAVQYGCYRNSRIQSAVLGGMLVLHRAIGTYRNKVTRYIALNEFCRSKFIEGGLPAERIMLKPNFVDLAPPNFFPREGFLFVGRLSSEKGVNVLVRAWQMMESGSLTVAGAGPEASLLENVDNLTALGALSEEKVHVCMKSAEALVLPSICYESFPRTLVEAFACALPVIASRLGPLANLVEDGVTGLLFEPGDAADLAQKLKWAKGHPQSMLEMGRNARAKYEAEFSAEQNYRQLIAIYDEAIAEVAKEID